MQWKYTDSESTGYGWLDSNTRCLLTDREVDVDLSCHRRCGGELCCNMSLIGFVTKLVISTLALIGDTPDTRAYLLLYGTHAANT